MYTRRSTLSLVNLPLIWPLAGDLAVQRRGRHDLAVEQHREVADRLAGRRPVAAGHLAELRSARPR